MWNRSSVLQNMPARHAKKSFQNMLVNRQKDIVDDNGQRVQTKRGSLGKPTSSDKYSGSVNRVHQFAVNFAVKFAVTQRRFRLLSGIYLFIDDEKDVSNSSAKWN